VQLHRRFDYLFLLGLLVVFFFFFPAMVPPLSFVSEYLSGSKSRFTTCDRRLGGRRSLIIARSAVLDKIDSVEVDDIFGYDKLVAAEKANLQAGMNYRDGKQYSIVLMSVRKGAPYADAINTVTGMISYEGHDVKNVLGGPDPKSVDQPLTNLSASLTENGKFYRDAMRSTQNGQTQ
jgi:hypothetical protein